jgi:ribonuclease P protein component
VTKDASGWLSNIIDRRFGGVQFLRHAQEFKAVYQRGAKRTSRSFVVFTLPNGLRESRFGLTTPRKLGKAHDRNRIRRRVREILRGAARIPPGIDWVINPRRSVLEQPFQELRLELLALMGITG